MQLTIIQQTEQITALRIDFTNGAIGTLQVNKLGGCHQVIIPPITKGESAMLGEVIINFLSGWLTPKTT